MVGIQNSMIPVIRTAHILENFSHVSEVSYSQKLI